MVIRRASNVPLGMADAGSCNNLFVKYVCDSTLVGHRRSYCRRLLNPGTKQFLPYF